MEANAFRYILTINRSSMRYIGCLYVLFFLATQAQAQYVYTIKADSVKITSCDSSELIIQNHTQNVPGFLFNTGNGRTIFQRGALNLGNGSYLLGADTLNLAANAWLQGGNAFGTTGILGTTDNNHLDFYTNNIKRARLDSLGAFTLGDTGTVINNILNVNGLSNFANNVTMAYKTTLAVGGIYVVDDFDGRYISCVPNEQMSITSGVGGYATFDGNVELGGGTGSVINLIPGGVPGPGITVSATSTTYPSNTTFSFVALRNDGLKRGIINTGDFNAELQGGTSAVDLYFYPGKETYSNSQGNTIIAYDGTNLRGNVGIGTPSPTAQLHTTGSVRFAGLTGDNTQTNILVSDSAGNVYYRSASSLAMNDIIRSSLAVNGTVTAKQLKLRQDNWPDYVFDSSYRLPALSDVEHYIRQQHHIPGVVSAADVRKDGADVGDMQAIMMKKIEELTLYVIEQQKELEQQRGEIKTLKRELHKRDVKTTDK